MRKKHIYLTLLLSLAIFGIFYVLNYNNLNTHKESTKATVEQIDKFNQIINESFIPSDIKRCNSIGNEELETACEKQLSNRFDESFFAPDISICKGLEKKDDVSSVLRQDMCILDLVYNSAKDKNDHQQCLEIDNKDILNACIQQVKNKKF